MPININIEDCYTPVSYDDFDAPALLIGFADKGPSMVPVYLRANNDPEELFGIGSELALGCRDAIANGSTNVMAFRINGKHSAVTLDSLITITSLSAGTRTNSYSVVVSSSDGVKYVTLRDEEAQTIRAFVFADTRTIGDLAQAINHSALYLDNKMSAKAIDATAALSTLSDTSEYGVFLTGGEDEDDLDEITVYDRLQSIYDSMTIADADVVCPLFARLDVKVPERDYYYNQLSEFCDNRLYEGYPVVGVIAARDRDTEEYPSTATYLEQVKLDMDKDDFINSRSVVITAGEIEDGDYGARSFAACLCGL
ncbi:MAG: hypothetical protein NWF07_11390, partial [Candidatus Bathyarchaeota archaeon]|nr:hypothetical protein [Candidatus Bathyarchaeota archaeon]